MNPFNFNCLNVVNVKGMCMRFSLIHFSWLTVISAIFNILAGKISLFFFSFSLYPNLTKNNFFFLWLFCAEKKTSANLTHFKITSIVSIIKIFLKRCVWFFVREQNFRNANFLSSLLHRKNEENFPCFMHELILNEFEIIFEKIVRIISVCFHWNLFIIPFTFENGLKARQQEFKRKAKVVGKMRFLFSSTHADKANVINVNIFFSNKFLFKEYASCLASTYIVFKSSRIPTTVPDQIYKSKKKNGKISARFVVLFFSFLFIVSLKISFHCLGFRIYCLAWCY